METAFTHITTAAEAKKILDNLEQKENSLYPVVKNAMVHGKVCSFARMREKVFFLEITEELPPQTLADCAKDFFTTKDMVKIGHNVKWDIHTVAPFGVEEFTPFL